MDKIVLPKFMEDIKEYRKCLDIIAKKNFIDWEPQTWASLSWACHPEPTYISQCLEKWMLTYYYYY